MYGSVWWGFIAGMLIGRAHDGGGDDGRSGRMAWQRGCEGVSIFIFIGSHGGRSGWVANVW